jgi:NadR type nicotinamide-nucleotide adenylyltransferase
VVFTSESYGDAYARYLGCEHVSVDPDRRHIPCSGTAVRADPLGHWERLAPCVRAHYALRICALGAESTGTTTLARALAYRYSTVWVPEYGREYWERKHARGEETWSTSELVHIAAEQTRMEDEAARSANRILFLDTNAFATTIWHERYLGFPSPEVEGIAAQHHADLYLLTDVDIPFVQDGTRDGEYLREWMHGRFLSEMERCGRPYVVVSGSHEQRMRLAVEAVDRLRAGYHGRAA